MTNYARGANRERQLQARLTEDGWVVQRSAGSKGVCDLLALRRGEAYLIEVKSGKTPFADFGPAKRKALREAAKVAGAKALLVHWPPNKVPVWHFEKSWPE
jgi:Holliday junction resolvase